MNNKRSRLIIFILYVMFTSGCSRDTGNKVNIQHEEEAAAFNYNIPNIYVYSIKATDSNDRSLYRDTLGLMCTNIIRYRETGQTISSWLYLSRATNGNYILNPATINNSSSGTLSNKDTLFIHPPRERRYTILQICPYPFLQFPLYIGKKWDWDLEVGSLWCPGGSIIWDGVELFKSKYEVADTVQMEIPDGKVICYHIHATNTSKFGISSADFYYSNKYGIVKLYYLPLDKTKIEFNFLSETDDPTLFRAIMPNYQAHQEYLDFVKQSSGFR